MKRNVKSISEEGNNEMSVNAEERQNEPKRKADGALGIGFKGIAEPGWNVFVEQAVERISLYRYGSL